MANLKRGGEKLAVLERKLFRRISGLNNNYQTIIICE